MINDNERLRLKNWYNKQLDKIECDRCRKVAHILNSLLSIADYCERYVRETGCRYKEDPSRFLCKPVSEALTILTKDIF